MCVNELGGVFENPEPRETEWQEIELDDDLCSGFVKFAKEKQYINDMIKDIFQKGDKNEEISCLSADTNSDGLCGSNDNKQQLANHSPFQYYKHPE